MVELSVVEKQVNDLNEHVNGLKVQSTQNAVELKNLGSNFIDFRSETRAAHAELKLMITGLDVVSRREFQDHIQVQTKTTDSVLKRLDAIDDRITSVVEASASDRFGIMKYAVTMLAGGAATYFIAILPHTLNILPHTLNK